MASVAGAMFKLSVTLLVKNKPAKKKSVKILTGKK